MGKFALLIGVSDYPEGFSALPAALNDVEAMREVLECPEMGGFEVTKLLNPTADKLRKSIEAFFHDRTSDDLVLLYFSGHGIADREGNFFFSATETKKAKGLLMESSAVAARDVYGYMRNCDSDRQVVILDCCHSGAFGDRIPRHPGDINFQDQLGGMGRVVLTASAAIDYSFERADEPLAIYTRYLVEGIKTGAADRDEDGYVSVDELHDYVVEKLSKAAPGMTPQRYLAKDGEKIRLTRAIVADPTRKYRKFVQQYIRDGEIGPTGRRILNGKRLELKLDLEVALTIENDECQPYREHRKNLEEYEACLVEELELKFPLGDRAKTELQDYWKKELKLTADEVAAIEDRVIAAFAVSHPVVEPIVEKVVVKPATPPKLQPFTQDLGTAGKLFGNAVKLEMLPIPSGEFMMGSPTSEAERDASEGPQHLVNVPAFYMGKFPITQAQWTAIAKTKEVDRILKANPSDFKGADLPVEQVSWHDAIEFCKRLSRETGKRYSLPSEAQWEYACRAGTTTPFHFGETIDASIANYCAQDWKLNGTTYSGKYGNGKLGEYREETTPVGHFKTSSNKFGLYDMHGNVWEWCEDSWHENYEGSPIDGSLWDPSNDSRSKVLRGGSWSGIPMNCRSANRFYITSDGLSGRIGFRVISSIPSP